MWGRAPRDIPLSAFDPALAGLGTLVSLGTGPLRAPLPDYPHILDGGAHIVEALDLAAAIAAIDIVVTSDSLAAHLAGAMGKPGIVVVAAARPWRWRSLDGRSVWYPTLDVVTQSRAGDWNAPMTALRSRLEELIASLAQPQELSK
jgi:ADP-heptose:LPS heptosyltransferase